MRRLLAAITSAAVFACAPPSDDGRTATQAPTASPSPAAPQPAQQRAPGGAEPTLPPVADLAGEWRVAGLDGQEIDRPYAIALSANGAQIWWEPRCAGQAVDYAIDGRGFSIVPLPRDLGEVCEIAVQAEVPRIWSALAAADTIERTPANGIRIHGGGREVLLFSQ